MFCCLTASTARALLFGFAESISSSGVSSHVTASGASCVATVLCGVAWSQMCSSSVERRETKLLREISSSLSCCCCGAFVFVVVVDSG